MRHSFALYAYLGALRAADQKAERDVHKAQMKADAAEMYAALARSDADALAGAG